jgi:hypothetical protein
MRPGSAGGAPPSPAGGGAWVAVRSLDVAAVTAQIARAVMTRAMCPQDRGVEPGLALVQAEAARSEFEALLDLSSFSGEPLKACDENRPKLP